MLTEEMLTETNEQRYLRLRWENDRTFRLSLWTLAHNLAVAAFGAAMFKAGDNFGFHMGSDEFGQCTCQWSPNVDGEPYSGSTRCEQEDDGLDGHDEYPDSMFDD